MLKLDIGNDYRVVSPFKRYLTDKWLKVDPQKKQEGPQHFLGAEIKR